MKKVVVLLPEGKLFDQLFEQAIAPAIPTAQRVSAEFSTAASPGAACNAIEAADLVIAELSSRNPNVMYQVGYAHGIGKKVLLLAEHLEAFPFDKARHQVIGYGKDRQFLRDELASFLQSGNIQSRAAAPEQEDARAKFMAAFGEILASHQYEHRGEIQMENATTFVLLNQDMDLPLVQDLARKARELGLRLKLM